MDIKNSLDLYRALTDANAQVAVDKARAGQNARKGDKPPMAANAHQLRLMFLEACYTGLMHDFGLAARDFSRVYSAEDMADALAPVCTILSSEELWSLIQALDIDEYLSETSEDKDAADEPTEDTEILDTVPEPEILDDNVVIIPAAATGNG